MTKKCRVLEGGLCEITQKYKKGKHDGIDLVGKNHTLAWEVAHSDGEVVGLKKNFKGFKEGSYGNYVKLKHADGYYTLYAHGKYNTAKVKVGDKVKRGDKLQYMGNTGYPSYLLPPSVNELQKNSQYYPYIEVYRHALLYRLL